MFSDSKFTFRVVAFVVTFSTILSYRCFEDSASTGAKRFDDSKSEGITNLSQLSNVAVGSNNTSKSVSKKSYSTFLSLERQSYSQSDEKSNAKTAGVAEEAGPAGPVGPVGAAGAAGVAGTVEVAEKAGPVGAAGVAGTVEVAEKPGPVGAAGAGTAEVTGPVGAGATGGAATKADQNHSRKDQKQSQQHNKDATNACLSKSEAKEYWKKALESPIVSKALDEYEEFHRECRSKEGNLTDLLLNQKPLPCKYFVYHMDWNGMGNRLMSLISGFLYAILTKRVLLIDNNFNFNFYFCQPFVNSSVDFPSRFPYTKFYNASIRMTDLFAKIRNDGSSDEAYQHPPYSLFLWFTHEPRPESHCPAIWRIYERVPVILVQSNQYYAQSFHITDLREKLWSLFPDDVIFPRLARRLFNPTNEIWLRIKAYYEAHLSQADFRYGIHLRAFGQTWRPRFSADLSDCMREEGLLPRVTSPQNSSRDFVDNARSSSVACLVTSMVGEFYNYLVAEYAGKSTDNNVSVSIHKVSDVTKQNSSGVDHNKEVLMEIWLLSFCDDLVMTPQSTFGYMASGLAGMKPLFLNAISRARPMGNVNCKRSHAVDPCYQFPAFNFTCPNKPVVVLPYHQLDIFAHCIDFVRGVRFVRPQLQS